MSTSKRDAAVKQLPTDKILVEPNISANERQDERQQGEARRQTVKPLCYLLPKIVKKLKTKEEAATYRQARDNQGAHQCIRVGSSQKQSGR